MGKLIGKAHKFGKKVANFGKPKPLRKLRNGIRKKADKFMASDVGKVVAAAVLIYFGGAALGYWGPGAQAGGTAGLAGAGGAGGAGGGAGGGGLLAAGQTSVGQSLVATGTGALDTALANAVPLAGTSAGTTAGLTALNPALAGVGTGAGAGTSAVSLAGGAGGAVDAGIVAGSSGSGASGIVNTIRSLARTTGNFVKENPELAFMGATMAGNMLGPTEAEEAAAAEEERWKRRNQNLAVGGVRVPGNVTATPLRTLDGNRVWDDDGGLVANFRQKVAAQRAGA